MNKKVFSDIWIFDTFKTKWTRIETNNGNIPKLHSFSAIRHNNIIFIMGGFVIYNHTNRDHN